MADQIIYSVKISDGVLLDPGDHAGLIFPWWSFTKTVLAAAALRLVDRGLLTLNDPLPGRPFTLHQLLQHTAGVPNYGRFAPYHEAVAAGDVPWTEEDLLSKIGANELDFTPGEGWTYSNIGYLFVRKLIEESTGSDIAIALQDMIFKPLDLRSPSLVTQPAELDNSAWGNDSRYHPGWVYHGLLTGTAADAVTLLDRLMSGHLLPPEYLDIMTTAL